MEKKKQRLAGIGRDIFANLGNKDALKRILSQQVKQQLVSSKIAFFLIAYVNVSSQIIAKPDGVLSDGDDDVTFDIKDTKTYDKMIHKLRISAFELDILLAMQAISEYVGVLQKSKYEPDFLFERLVMLKQDILTIAETASTGDTFIALRYMIVLFRTSYLFFLQRLHQP